MTKRELERELKWRAKVKAWVVRDPFTVYSGRSAFLESFDSKAEADQWLAEQLANDDDGFCGCDVIPKEDYLRIHCRAL